MTKTDLYVDVDNSGAQDGIVRITLTVQQGISRGQLSISGRGTLSALSGNNSDSLTLEGMITPINSALKRVTFKAKWGLLVEPILSSLLMIVG